MNLDIHHTEKKLPHAL